MKKVQETAPKRIWLQVADDEFVENEIFCGEYSEEVTWSTDQHVAVTVPYARADLLQAAEKHRDELLALVIRYRTETPLGHQPHMIAHLADAAISSVKGKK